MHYGRYISLEKIADSTNRICTILNFNEELSHSAQSVQVFVRFGRLFYLDDVSTNGNIEEPCKVFYKLI